MPGQWKPIHENHAIDVMAAVLTFSEPIPIRLLSRALKLSEDAAFAAGLRSRHSMTGVQFTIGSRGVSAGANVPVRGQTFNASFPVGEEGPASRISEQLQVDQGAVIYRTWSYVSWDWQIKRMRELMSPALEVTKDAVAIGTQRLEYLDRFRFEGEIGEADVRAVLRADSRFVAPHVFTRTDLWHSHTGAFLPTADSAKRLIQVHIDALDDPPLEGGLPPGSTQTRWIHLMTACEDRMQAGAIDDDDAERRLDTVFDRFGDQHSETKELFAAVVTDDVAERVSLRGN